MVLQSEVLIDGNDIGAYLVDWKVDLEIESNERNRAIITCNRNVLTAFNISINNSITIKRGTVTATDNNIFTGFVIEITEDNGAIVIKCKDPLYRGTLKYITRSYDKNIDTEAGVISAIWSDIVTQDLELTPNVQSTGTVDVMDKFICNDDEVLERLQALTKIVDWQMYYNFVSNEVILEPKGNQTFATPFVVGGNVINNPTWSESTEGMFNKITLKGAVSVGIKTETFSGDTIETDFILSEEPEDTKVSISGVEKVRGNPGSTDTFDYYIDKINKKLIFISAPASGTDNISIEYSYKIPIPVQSKNSSSISQYGLYESRISLEDIKTTDDATLRVQKLLAAFSNPFISTELQTVNVYDLYPGYLVNVVDDYNGKNVNAVVKKITYQYPEGFDLVTVGTRIFDLQDFVTDTQKRIRELEKKELINVTILNQLLQEENIIELRNIAEIWRATLESDVLYYDSDVQGDWGDSTTLTTSISNYWKLDTNNTTQSDELGNNDLSVSGAVFTSSGLIGGAYDFDGSNDVLTSVGTHTFGADWSLNQWVNVDTITGANDFILRHEDGGVTEAIQCVINTGGVIELTLRDSSIFDTSLISTDAITTSGWHMVTLVKEGSTKRIYVNAGTPVSNTAGRTPTTLTMNYANVGAATVGMDGKMDEMGVWDKALSAAEITSLYNSASGLQYPFITDEGFDWGDDTTETQTLSQRTHLNNIYWEDFRDNDLVNTGSTTCTVDTTNHQLDFTTGEIYQSESIFKYKTTQITSSRLTIDSSKITNVENLTFELSSDGGSNYETISLGAVHTFTDIGVELLLKITVSDTASINFDDDFGKSLPLKLEVNI